MNELYLLLCETDKRARDLSDDEFDPAIKEMLLDDLHRLRGRLMQGAKDQKWQQATGTVEVY